jgi:hypothetical protein
LRGLLSVGPAVRAIAASGEERVREAVAQAIAPFTDGVSGYRIANTFRYLSAAA